MLIRAVAQSPIRGIIILIILILLPRLVTVVLSHFREMVCLHLIMEVFLHLPYQRDYIHVYFIKVINFLDFSGGILYYMAPEKLFLAFYRWVVHSYFISLTVNIALLFYLLLPYLLSFIRGSRNVRNNMHIIKTIMKFCVLYGMTNPDAGGIRAGGIRTQSALRFRCP